MRRAVCALAALAASTAPAASTADQALPAPAPVCGSLQACRDELARERQAVRWLRHDRDQTRRAVLRERRRRWRLARPTIEQAAEIAGHVYHVDPGSLVRVSACEIRGHWRPWLRFAPYVNHWSQARGPWQFLPSTWRHTPWARFDPADVFVAALAAAQIVASDGNYRQWSCRWAA